MSYDVRDIVNAVERMAPSAPTTARAILEILQKSEELAEAATRSGVAGGYASAIEAAYREIDDVDDGEPSPDDRDGR